MIMIIIFSAIAQSLHIYIVLWVACTITNVVCLTLFTADIIDLHPQGCAAGGSGAAAARDAALLNLHADCEVTTDGWDLPQLSEHP